MNLFTWYWLLVVVVSILYAALMLWFMVGWDNIRLFISEKKALSTSVSIILPFKNEANTIEKCLEGLLNQNIEIKNFTVIAVNDHSTDKSVKIVEKLAKKYNRLVLLNSSDHGKKQALSYGINQSDAELIITTDADCEYGNNWLQTIVEYYEKHRPGLIIGPVTLNAEPGLFQRFQLLEFNSLIMTTAGAAGIGHPIMCNGANLAFKKDLYESIDNPMNDEYLSGDDIFLLHNIKRESDESIHFLKSYDAVVKTQAQLKIKNYFKQRERWASKAKGYSDADTIFTAYIVFGISVLMICGLGLFVISWHFIKPFAVLFAVKLMVDLTFFNKTNSFFSHRMPFLNLLLFEFIYGFYFFIAGFLGLVKSKQWKKEKGLH